MPGSMVTSLQFLWKLTEDPPCIGDLRVIIVSAPFELKIILDFFDLSLRVKIFYFILTLFNVFFCQALQVRSQRPDRFRCALLCIRFRIASRI